MINQIEIESRSRQNVTHTLFLDEQGKAIGCSCEYREHHTWTPCPHMTEWNTPEQKSQPKGVVVYTQKPVYCDESDDPFINAALREQMRKDEERTRLNYYELAIGA